MDIPKENNSDKVHTAIKALTNLIPIAGGTITEIFNALVIPPIEKRKQKWMEDVVTELKILEERQTGIIEQLVNNEEFISLLMSASVNAYKTHLKEKHEKLRNVLFNSIESEIIFDLKQVFLNFVDELTLPHLDILEFIDVHEEKIRSLNEFERIYLIWAQERLILNENKITLDTFRYIMKDLEAKGLIYISDDMLEVPNKVYVSDYLTTNESENNELPFVKISELGQTFISFIKTKDI